MKKLKPGRWFKPSYNYSYAKGVTTRRSKAAFLYLLVLSVPVAIAMFSASLQVQNGAYSTNVRLASAPIIHQPTTQNTILAPAVSSIGSQDTLLQSAINNFVSSHTDHTWSIQVQGLGTDERAASYAPVSNYRSASLYKLLMMYPLAQKTPISQWGSVSLNAGGHTMSLSDCVTAMLKVSDNSCGDAVGDYVGWANADAQLKTIGLENTNLDDPNGPITTAKDMTYYLQGLYEGKWFDGATRAAILNIMNQQVLRSGIPAGCGSACSVGDKTGDLGFVRHDAAIVTYSGGAYALSIFSSGASYAQIAQLAGQIQSYMAAN